VLDSPVSENATTAAAIGAAIAGLRPIVVHPRMDFMLLAVDPIVNQAANWSYMFAGQQGVPMVIRPIINRGGEQAAQHSQAAQAFFMHVPGIKVVMPATPYDAKGLLVSAVYDGNPVMYIEDRWLYAEVGDVPEELYEVPIGKAAMRREGRDVTIVASSFMAAESLKAAAQLEARGVDAEVIDLRSIKPWDKDCVVTSARKTGRVVIADGGWRTCGVAAEVAATLAEEALHELKAPIARVTLPDAPAPMSAALEKRYYPNADSVVEAVLRLVPARSLA
jgi:pyruvate dehydrogenase E1 component beta subunit